MAKFTPGEWEVDPLEKGWVVTGDGSLVANCNGTDFSVATEEANARLIAAAPKLYEACKEALIILTGYRRENFDKAMRESDYPEAPYHFLYEAVSGVEE